MDGRHVGLFEHEHGHITVLEVANDRLVAPAAGHAPVDVLAELLACCGIAAAAPVALDLVGQFQSFAALLRASAEEIVVRTGAVHELAALVAAFGRLHHVALSEEISERATIGSIDALQRFALHRLRGSEVEEIIVLLLDRKNGVIREHTIRVGTVDHVQLYPRDVVRLALLYNAVSVILLHNHPSGDPTPSRQDIEMTQAIASSLANLGIALHEHLIVGANHAIGLKAQGLI